MHKSHTALGNIRPAWIHYLSLSPSLHEKRCERFAATLLDNLTAFPKQQNIYIFLYRKCHDSAPPLLATHWSGNHHLYTYPVSPYSSLGSSLFPSGHHDLNMRHSACFDLFFFFFRVYPRIWKDFLEWRCIWISTGETEDIFYHRRRLEEVSPCMPGSVTFFFLRIPTTFLAPPFLLKISWKTLQILSPL